MLSERIIQNTGPESKTRILWDHQVKGLGVRITPRGVKASVLDYRINGRRHRVALARTTEISLRTARKRAGAELVRIRAGEDDLLTWRRAAYVPARLEAGRLGPRTADTYRRQAARHLRPACQSALKIDP